MFFGVVRGIIGMRGSMPIRLLTRPCMTSSATPPGIVGMRESMVIRLLRPCMISSTPPPPCSCPLPLKSHASVFAFAYDQADVWSAGVILFTMLAGHPPMEQASETDWWFRALKVRVPVIRVTIKLIEQFDCGLRACPFQEHAINVLRRHTGCPACLCFGGRSFE